MHPAFSVIFLTTLIGVGQGLFLALFTAQSYAAVGFVTIENPKLFYTAGSFLSLLFLVGGLLASFFHLGHPERAWRSAARWRTSWLSREVIALPAMMGIVFLYGLMHFMGWNPNIIGAANPLQGQLTLFVGIVGTIAAFALFLCTGMIYACIKFLQEWHTPLTVINYILLGTASGFMLATLYASYTAPNLVNMYGTWTIIITLVALVTRIWSLIRNSRIKHRSSLQTAIGVRHTGIVQKSMGMMGGSYNTREYFHGTSPEFFNLMKWTFLLLVFPVSLLLLFIGLENQNIKVLALSFAIQYAGLVAERWFFFAQAKHPQNLYYQSVG
jgi:DMSO reductase anchor subunit